MVELKLIVRQSLRQIRQWTSLKEGLIVAFLTLGLLVATHVCAAQSQSQIGIPPFSSFDSDSFSSVNLANLDVHIEIPLRSLPGRGLPLNARLISETNTLGPPGTTGGGSQIGWTGTGANYGTSPRMGNFVGLGITPGIINYTTTPTSCYYNNTYYTFYVYSNFTYLDSNGTPHGFDSSIQVAGLVTLTNGTQIQCPSFYPQSGWGTNMQYSGQDGSDYTIFVSSGAAAPSARVLNIATGVTNDSVDADNNSNTFFSGTLKDSTGNTALTVSSNLSGSPYTTTFTYLGPDGTTNEHIVVTWSSFTGTGAVNCSGIANPSVTGYRVTSIALPDGTSYGFTYEPVLGRPHVITLPTGGTITYNWNGSNAGISCLDGGSSGFTKTTQDGTWTYARAYNSTTKLWTTTVTDPLGDQSVHTFGASGSGYYVPLPQYEIQSKVYQNIGGTQTLLKTVVTCYDGNFTNCSSAEFPAKYSNGVLAWPFQKDVYTYLPNVSGPSLSEQTYRSESVLTEEKDYDFGAAMPPSTNFIRDRKIAYQLYSCISSDITTNSAGTTLAKTTATCDTHGHPTAVNKWISGSTYATAYYTYYTDGNGNETGVLHTMTNPIGTVTTYSNLDCNNSFPQTVTTANLTTTTQWDCNGEVPKSLTDANGQTTTFSYGSDPFWRLLQTTYPDGGQTATAYNDTGSPPNFVSSTLLDSSNRTVYTQINVDGLNRPIRKITWGQGVSNIYVDTTYDSLGRVHSVSNPYYSTSDSTYGITTFAYDALSQKVEQTSQDGNHEWWCYLGQQTAGQPNCNSHFGSKAGFWTDYQDQGGSDWQRTIDGLGRMLDVLEPSGSGTAPSLETDYTYDGIGNLLQVDQYGGAKGNSQYTDHQRFFSYDQLSRLIQAYNPESGWVCYGTTPGYSGSTAGAAPNGSNCTEGYDADSNLLYKTDARAVTIHYSFDNLNRLTGKTYVAPSGLAHYTATAPVSYTYDSGSSSYHPIGRRTGMTDGAGTETWGYDSMGRVIYINRTIATPISTQSDWAGWTYNYDGTLSTVREYTGTSLQYSYNGIGEATGVSYIDSSGTHPYGSTGTYDAAGHLAGLNMGGTNTDMPAITAGYAYNNRLQLHTISAMDSSATVVYSHTYCYASCYGGAPTFNNGNIQLDTDGNRAAYTATYKYDTLNRLLSGQSTTWGDSYTYDPFGNLYKKIPLGSGYGENLNASPTPQNQLSGIGVSYDANGQVTQDNLGMQYSYDSEGRIATAGSWTYSYDGDGSRVLRSGGGSLGNTYWYNPNGTVSDEQSINLAPGHTWPAYLYRNIYFDGNLLVKVGFTPSVNPSYMLLPDQIGSTRISFNATTNPPNITGSHQTDYYPFGGYVATPTDPTIQQRFTGKERDSESGNDYFGARYYGSSTGRFLSADPSGLLYADPANPQSFNLYNYGLNNPLVNIDPNGLDCIHVNVDTGVFEGFERGDCDNSTEEKANSGQYVDGTVTSITTSNGTTDPADASGIVRGYSGTNDDTGALISGTFAAPMDAPLQPVPQVDLDELRVNQLVQGIATDTRDLLWLCNASITARGEIPKTPIAVGFSVDKNGMQPSARLKLAKGAYGNEGNLTTNGKKLGFQFTAPIVGTPFKATLSKEKNQTTVGVSRNLPFGGNTINVGGSLTFGYLGDAHCRN